MEKDSFPDDIIEACELLNTDEWKILSSKSSIGAKFLAAEIRKIEYPQRCIKSLDQFLKFKDKVDSKENKFMAAITFLSDEALDKFISTFTEEDRKQIDLLKNP